ncbi:MAG: ABC transporter permease [Chloroflexota bacterium]
MTTAAATVSTRKRARESSWTIIARFFRDKPLGAAGAAVFFGMIIIALIGPWITPYDPLSTDVMHRLQGPSWAHLMGTDEVGRDVVSRVILGARVSAIVGIGATLVGTTVGAVIGVISGYVGGKVDMGIQRIMDMIMAFPGLVLAIAIMAVLGPSIINVILAISIPSMPRANRVIRSIAVSVKEFPYIEAARAVGCRPWRIILRHVIPNTLASYLIVATSMLGAAILIEASLSFLGLGIPPPHPSWGRSLSEAMQYMYKAPWLSIFPGLAISMIVFAVNMFGDALRDVWDPRLKRL